MNSGCKISKPVDVLGFCSRRRFRNMISMSHDFTYYGQGKIGILIVWIFEYYLSLLYVLYFYSIFRNPIAIILPKNTQNIFHLPQVSKGMRMHMYSQCADYSGLLLLIRLL
jgi:hypothetical protein